MPASHWMQFATFAEQRHFVYPNENTYNGVVLNANMVAHAPGGIAAFILEKTGTQTSYIIDPLTHAYQHNPEFITNSAGALKSSIKSLAHFYGSPLLDILGDRPLLPRDFSKTENIVSFTKNVIDFQNNFLSGFMADSGSAKYLDDVEANPPPYALIAPYFYFTETTIDLWLDVYKKCAIQASEYVSDISESKFFLSMVVSQGVIVDEALYSKIADSVADIDCDGFLLWIDNFDETQASTKELEGFLKFGRRLRHGEREVINLHGGYFSVLASGAAGSHAITGVSHGPEFGEFRSVVPVGGGIPIAKYYMPDLHRRERYRDALQIFRKSGWLESSEEFHSNVCNCDECQSVINGDIANFAQFGDGNIKSVKRKTGIVRIQYPTTETKMKCLRHYLSCKQMEYENAANQPKTKLLDDLENTINRYEEIVGLDGISHLRKWHHVLSEI